MINPILSVTLFSIVGSLISSNAAFASLQQQSAQNAQHPGTFAYTLVQQGPAAAQITQSLYSNLGSECANYALTLYSAGNSFWSAAVYYASMPISDMTFISGVTTGPHGRWFSHWTNAQPFIQMMHPEITDREAAHARIMSEGGYGRGFIFYRTRAVNNPLLRVHYVAEDSVSSQMYGDTNVEFELSPQARYLPEPVENPWGFYSRAYQEIEARHPGFVAACAQSHESLNTINYFILDDSMIDLAGYQSFDRWYQLISTRHVVGSRVSHK